MLIYCQFLAVVPSVGSYIVTIAFPHTNEQQLVDPGFRKGSNQLSAQTGSLTAREWPIIFRNSLVFLKCSGLWKARTVRQSTHYVSCQNKTYVNHSVFYVNGPTRCTFYVLIYSTIFTSTLHVSNERFVHHQQFIIVYRAV